MLGDFEHAQQKYTENTNDHHKAHKAKGFTHNSKDRVVDGLGEVAGSLNGIADTHTKKPTHADSHHGVVYMIGGVAAFATGESGNPGIYALHTVTRGGDGKYGHRKDNSHHEEILLGRNARHQEHAKNNSDKGDTATEVALSHDHKEERESANNDNRPPKFAPVADFAFFPFSGDKIGKINDESELEKFGWLKADGAKIKPTTFAELALDKRGADFG